MGWGVGRRFKREGTYVYLWLIHVDVQQKPTQHCKANILQLIFFKLEYIYLNINLLMNIYVYIHIHIYIKVLSFFQNHTHK